MDCHFHLRVRCDELLQICEGTMNDTTLRAMDALALGLSTNFQGRTRFFILETGKVLQRQWQDVEACKMLVTEVSRMNHMHKQQCSVKGLKFDDLQNLVDDAISTGVTEDAPTCDSLRNTPSSKAPKNSMQHGMIVAGEDISEHQEGDVDDIIEEVTDDSDNESISEDNDEDNDEGNDGGDGDNVSVENRANEVVIVEETAAQPVVQGCTTRSDRLSKPHDAQATTLFEMSQVW